MVWYWVGSQSHWRLDPMLAIERGWVHNGKHAEHPTWEQNGKNVANLPPSEDGEKMAENYRKNGKLARSSIFAAFFGHFSPSPLGGKFATSLPFFSHVGCSARFPLCYQPRTIANLCYAYQHRWLNNLVVWHAHKLLRWIDAQQLGVCVCVCTLALSADDVLLGCWAAGRRVRSLWVRCALLDYECRPLVPWATTATSSSSTELRQIHPSPRSLPSPLLLWLRYIYQELSGTPTSGGIFSKVSPVQIGRRTAVQMGGVLQYKLEVYCCISISPKLRSQRGTALQMGGVLRYKLEVYRQYFSDKLYGLGAPKQSPI